MFSRPDWRPSGKRSKKTMRFSSSGLFSIAELKLVLDVEFYRDENGKLPPCGRQAMEKRECATILLTKLGIRCQLARSSKTEQATLPVDFALHSRPRWCARGNWGDFCKFEIVLYSIYS